jgi:peptidoglycan hydrolase FlgJ
MIQNILQNSFDSTLQKTSTNQLENQLKKNYASSTDDELMDVCREFESYFTEQVFKSMYKMVPQTESQDNSAKQLKDYFQDQMITEYSKKASEGEGLGIAQMMYEQMKRNKVV